MRFCVATAAVCLSLLAGSTVFADPDAPADAAKSAAPPPAASSSSDAAAKHAKRTACLKDAKTKKLLGAEKTSFLKGCIEAP
jgi:hypothetical protein